MIEEFLGPRELATVFSETLINMYPFFYDAYGMTSMKAAAFSAPSLINGVNTVGAMELIS